MTLRSLAIFEIAAPAEDAPPAFQNLLHATAMAPSGMPSALLRGCGLVVCESRDEAALLEDMLGVLRLTEEEFMRSHVLNR